MHPATIAAVAILLLNDIVFKAVWPGSWLTGKLSDISWVVFAPPLLAFLLSFVVGRNVASQRLAFLAAYVGLPLLYAAYNSFAPLHDLILRGLQIASGARIGSPLDPSDSLAIPLGLGVALWVWRRPITAPNRLRWQWGLVLAVVAAVASIASSGTPASTTEWQAGVAIDGAVIVEVPYKRYYKSNDGGETWERGASLERESVEWGLTEVRTPRGTYSLGGSEIVLTAPGSAKKEVYSYGFLSREDNEWAQAYGTRHIRYDLTGLYEDPDRHVKTEPVNMVFDVGSGNVIVAMGMQGVLIGDVEGNWRGVAVGDFAPMDFTFFAKLRLLSSFYFWVGVAAFTLLFLVVVLVLAQPRRGLPAFYIGENPGLYQVFTLVLAFVFGMPGALFAFAWELSIFALPHILVPAVALAAFAWSWPGDSLVRKSMAVVFALSGAILAFQYFPPFSVDSGLFLDIREDFFGALGLALCLMAIVAYPPLPRQVKTFSVGLVAMVSSIILPLALWLMGVLIVVLASVASALMLLLISYALFKHLYHQDTTPIGPAIGPSNEAGFSNAQ